MQGEGYSITRWDLVTSFSEICIRSACVLPLHDAIIRLRDGSLPPRSVP